MNDTLWKHWRAGDEKAGERLLACAEELEPGQLVQLAVVKQQHEWQRGNHIRAETWFERYPALASDRDCAVDLIYAEYLLESAAGNARADKYLVRFPQLASVLQRQFNLEHDFVAQPPEDETQAECLGTFGEYELLEIIARGGMGVVYKARQRGLDRLVALKMIKAGRFADETAVQRFYVEAKAAAELQHRSIVTVYEVGDVAGEHFYSMEYIAGSSLAELIREQPLDPLRTAKYVRTIATAIQYAHDRGILHRDLKPSNVLLDEQGEPRIADFGLARSIEDDSQITASVAVLGTPSYMSPEQAAGGSEPVGPASDIYSLGATLYDLLTGRPPFRAANAFDTRQQVLDTDPASPRLLNGEVPRDLETICLKCLEKDPGKRYASASALADDLERFLDSRPVHARRISRLNRFTKWAYRNPLVASLTIVIGLLLLAVAVGSSLAANSFRRIADEQQQQLAKNYLVLGNEHFEDGEIASGMIMALMAWQVSTDPRQRRSALNLLAGYGASLGQCLPHDSSVYEAVLSPDGTRFATGTVDGHVYLWNADGTPEAKLDTGHEQVQGIALSADSQLILVLCDSAEMKIVQLWDIEAEEVTASLSDPAWHPLKNGLRFLDGQPIAAMQNSDQDVALWNVAKRRPLDSLVMRHHEHVHLAWFHPDNPWLITSGQSGKLQIWNIKDGEQVATLYDPIRPEFPVDFDVSALWKFIGGDVIDRVTSIAFKQKRNLLTVGTSVLQSLWDTLNIPITSGSPSDFEVYSAWKPIKGDKMDCVCSIDVDPQRNLLAAGSFRFLRLWDLNTGTLLAREQAHRSTIYGLAFDIRGGHLYSGSTDRTMADWDISMRRLHKSGKRQLGSMHSIEVGDMGRTLMASTDACHILFDIDHSEDLSLEPIAHESMLTAAIFGPRQQTLLTADIDGFGRLRKLPDHPHRICHERLVWHGAVSTDNRLAVTCEGTSTWEDSDPRKALVWELETGNLMHTLQHPAPISGVSFIDRDNTLLTACADGVLRVWDVPSGQLRSVLWRQPDAIQSLAVSRDGQLFAIGDHAGMIRVWETSRRQLLWEKQGHSAVVSALSFGPRGELLVSGGHFGSAGSGNVLQWNARTGKATGKRLNHSGATVGLAVSPDPDRPLVAVAYIDGQVRLFELETGEPFGKPIQHTQDHVYGTLFTPDGDTLITACGDHRVNFWDVQTQMPSAPPIRHASRVAIMLDTTRDGRWLLCGDGTPLGAGGGYIRDLPPKLEDDPRRVTLWVQTVTGLKRWNPTTGSIQPLAYAEWLECRTKLNALGGPPFIQP